MSETVSVTEKEFARLRAVAELQEDYRLWSGSLLSLFAPLKTVDESCDSWAKRLRKAVQTRCVEGCYAEKGEVDINGETERTWNEHADLSPVGLGSVYGKFLLELARRFEIEGDLEARQRRRNREVLE